MLALEVIATLISACGLWLTARRNLLSWPVSLVGVAMYGFLFFKSKLYSDMLLQVFFGVSCIYGWYQWKRGSVAGGPVAIAEPSRRETTLGVVAGSLGALVLGSSMARFTDAASPWLDSTLTSFSLIAQLWTARRFIQSWWLWIGLDVVYIGLYAYKHLYPTAGLYAAFIVICAYGAADWRRAAGAAGSEPS